MIISLYELYIIASAIDNKEHTYMYISGYFIRFVHDEVTLFYERVYLFPTSLCYTFHYLIHVLLV